MKIGESGVTALRGAVLVERTIAEIERSGGMLGGCDPSRRVPLAPDTIARLRLANGAPLPPSLTRFLAYDSEWLGLTTEHRGELRLEGLRFREMMKREFDAHTADVFGGFEAMLSGHCYALPGGSDSRCFMYVGASDVYGEYPILLVDTDDVPFFCLEYPGLDVYLAAMFGAIDLARETYAGAFEDPVYGYAMVEQARLNLHGFKSIDFGGAPEHVDGEEVAQMQMSRLFGEDDVPSANGA